MRCFFFNIKKRNFLTEPREGVMIIIQRVKLLAGGYDLLCGRE